VRTAYLSQIFRGMRDGSVLMSISGGYKQVSHFPTAIEKKNHHHIFFHIYPN
jgi:hypothetical protein